MDRTIHRVSAISPSYSSASTMFCPAISYYALLFAFFLSQATAWIHNTPNVYLIRHGEKSGLSKDHGLNSEGELRAECLRNVFGANSTYDIKYILAPKFNKGM